MLRIDINLVFVIINIIIFFILVRVFLFKPVMSMIEKRKELIDSQFKKAEEVNMEAASLKEQYEASLQGAKEESVRIIESARARGKEEYDQIVSEAENHSRILMEKTNRSIERQQEKALADVQSEIAGLAMAAAAKIIGEAGSDQIGDELYNEFLTKAGKQHDMDG